MSIERIDAELCTDCGIGVDSCPMDMIRMDERIYIIHIRNSQE